MKFLERFTSNFLNAVKDKKEVSSFESKISDSTISNDSTTTRCIDLDRKIRDYDVLISELTKKNLKTGIYKDQIKDFSDKRKVLQLEFIKLNCVDKIESKKIQESADLLGTGFSQYEVDVLEKSRKEQNILYLVGGSVLLLGLYLIVKK
jgi:hypothetical protein